MKYSWNWLKEWLPLTWTQEQLAERLTMAGIEVEGIEVQGKGLDQVVVAQVLKSEKHPNADRLSVCQVDSGSGQKQIVCGAKNYKMGDKVPLALPGAKLPNGLEIKRSKLRGVESDGMMCSAKELGLAEDAEGLLILDPGFKTGQSLAEALGLNDIIFDLEITPNRPDLLSHWGLAREIAALAALPSLDPQRILSEEEEKRLFDPSLPNSGISIRIEDPVRCMRYTGRVIRGLKVGPSPEWLKRRLESLGHRSISNVVDITNYVMHELGQPLHAFDLALLKGTEIRVRDARSGENLLRLDNETSELKAGMLVIADAERPVALAGIIGGSETGVSFQTTDIFLESASFQPASIRKTSKLLGVSTDSSYRFERGVDIELASWAGLRATSLILQVCGGRLEGGLMDVRYQPPMTRKIPCRYFRVQSLLGIPISPEETNSALKRLGCRITEVCHAAKNRGAEVANEFSMESSQVEPPSYRMDLEREIDLIEEAARVHGIDRIPGNLPSTSISTTRDSDLYLFARRLRSIATALGLEEAYHYSIVSSSDLREEVPHIPMDSLTLANPISMEMDVLRPSLFTGLLHSCARNFATGNQSVTLFEIGRIFCSKGAKVGESLSLGLIVAGRQQDGAPWEKDIYEKPYDFFHLKGLVDELLRNLGIQGAQFQEGRSAGGAFLETGSSLALVSDGRVIGCLGQVRTGIARRLKLTANAYYAELDVEWLYRSQTVARRYKPWPVFPSIRRDIALTVATGAKHQHIEEALKRLAKNHAEPRGIFLQNVDLFDIFSSNQLGTGRKSMAYSMVYRSPTKTLTDQEINEIHNKIKESLKDEVCCEIRE